MMPTEHWRLGSATGLTSLFKRNQSLWAPGGVRSQDWNLKELTEGHHKAWMLRLHCSMWASYLVWTHEWGSNWSSYPIVWMVVHGRFMPFGWLFGRSKREASPKSSGAIESWRAPRCMDMFDWHPFMNMQCSVCFAFVRPMGTQV